MSKIYRNFYLYTILSLIFASCLTSARFSTSRKCPGHACRNPLAINIKQIQRLQRIKQQILYALGFQQNKLNRNQTTSSKEPRDNTPTSIITADNKTDIVIGGPEIVSFSQSIGKRNRKKSLLQFVIHIGEQKSNLEVVSAHLWLVVRKRGNKKTNKTIVIKVFKVQDKKKSQLTYLRTHVKKTRWQKLSLPISVVQELLNPNEGRLKLKIECKRCGRSVKLVVPKGSKRKRTKFLPTARSLRLRSLQRRHRPFLVINTRIRTK
ncbi:hypothetical protein LOTGIDRAFT_174638 [Lottia gigantea]|uniref:Uncharacterized protein n=1 Tax=Lottia gigantea TaxID=225164 RepID=V4C620_LOTGI|nr:hypothetical protein LOTGIDRAFT_174638 [Lottia gigantea]ESO97069.1 hypothetical protein LOTGIDRAFT_174638 [Lottia gigantea]